MNPDHLFLGTKADNVLEMVSKGRQSTSRGERNSFSKLTKQEILAIREDDRRQPQIAKDYGITQSHVSNIKRRANWAHVP